MNLGIDLGTSELKLLLLDDAGQVQGQCSAPLTVERPQPLWSEQSPADWWRATELAVMRLRDAHPQAWSQVRGIGLSGQMHGAVLLDAQHQPLRPAILWNDGRSHEECAELTSAVPRLHALAGNLAMPGFTAPKLLWVRRHEPWVFEQLRSVLLPKDYLRLLLTGERVSEPSDAAGTLWLDVAARDWSEPLLAGCGLNRSHMPRLVDSQAISGHLRPALAAAWGLAPGVLVAGGAGDNAASAIGIGAVAPGQGFISLGTSGVLFVVDDGYRPNPAAAVHTFCHALPRQWHRMSVMLSAASALRWLTQVTGPCNEATLMTEAEALDDAALDQAPLFLPYLAGERTPHNNALASGTLHGLRHDTTRGQIAQAVVEGVAFGLADGLAALQLAPGEVPRLALVGGGARSAHWAQLLADVLALEIGVPAGAEAGAALGAARLAHLCRGGVLAQVCPPPALARLHRPVAARHEQLQARLARFRALYPALYPALHPTRRRPAAAAARPQARTRTSVPATPATPNTPNSPNSPLIPKV